MASSRALRVIVAGALLLIGSAIATPAPADAVGGYFGWLSREDATDPGASTTYSWSGPDAGLHLWGGAAVIRVYTDSSQGQALDATFTAPAGQTLGVGTYTADAWPETPTSRTGRMVELRDGTMCGKTEEELFYLGDIEPPNPATGWFRISEIEFDSSGKLSSFAATYEINCQFVGGALGVEGTIAVNATLPPDPVPDAPTTGPVTGLSVTNVGPNYIGDDETTLKWVNPAGYGDVTVDFVQESDPAKLPAVIPQWFIDDYRGRMSSLTMYVEFMSTRTYRVIARGPTGRMGPPSTVTVIGTRLWVDDQVQRVMIGQEVRFSGRLSEAWRPPVGGDPAAGPGLVGRPLFLCQTSTADYLSMDCNEKDRTTTGAEGRFTLTVSPRRNHEYRVVSPARTSTLGNATFAMVVMVAPRTDLRAVESARVSRVAAVPRGSVIHFSTSRAKAGSRGFVRLQRWNGHRWRTVMTRRLDSGTGRRLALPYREYKRGRHVYRVVKPGDAHHVNGRSRLVHLRVR